MFCRASPHLTKAFRRERGIPGDGGEGGDAWGVNAFKLSLPQSSHCTKRGSGSANYVLRSRNGVSRWRITPQPKTHRHPDPLNIFTSSGILIHDTDTVRVQSPSRSSCTTQRLMQTNSCTCKWFRYASQCVLPAFLPRLSGYQLFVRRALKMILKSKSKGEPQQLDQSRLQDNLLQMLESCTQRPS